MCLSPSITVTPVETLTQRVSRHKVSFLFRIKGEPDSGTLARADAEMMESFCRLISGGVHQKDGEEPHEKLGGFFPEPVSDTESGAALYNIVWMADREIPLYKADQTPSFNLSVESLAEEGPAVLIGLYAKHGIQLEHARTMQFVYFEQCASSRVSVN